MANDNKINVGSEVEFSWGREHFQPMQYHGFDVGPFTMRTTIQAGETYASTAKRCMGLLRKAAAAEHSVKTEEYLERVRDVDRRTKASRG